MDTKIACGQIYGVINLISLGGKSALLIAILSLIADYGISDGIRRTPGHRFSYPDSFAQR